MNKLLSTLMVSLATVSCMNTAEPQQESQHQAMTLNSSILPKNIIMIIGDGMGPAYTSAYRYYSDDPSTAVVEETVFDRHLVGLSSTYPAPISGYVTDSAAGATALSTGIKTYNGAIGLDAEKKPVETVLEWAKKQGKKTGVVVTSQINHATPASYLSHNESRQNYDAIANSYIDDGIKADLYLGGGWQYFIRDDRNLVAEFQQLGFHYIDSYAGLNSLPSDKPVLGLFADQGLPWAVDDSDKHRLSTMTKAATTQLENDQGYFMLIEASQIDWGGHSNDISAAMAEMDDLAKTLEYLEQYVKQHPDTLVVLTADHSTGGLTLAANGKYQWQPEILRTMTQSPHKIAQTLAQEPMTHRRVNELLNFDISEQEFIELEQIKADTLLQLEQYLSQSKEQQKNSKKPKVAAKLYQQLNKVIDHYTATGWTSKGHTAIDVPVFALGQHSEQFVGLNTNTELAKKIFHLLGKSPSQTR